MTVNGEALQLHAVYKKLYFLLQVTQESVSGTASHARIRIRYYKSRAIHASGRTEEKSVRDCQTDYFSCLKIADNYTGKDEIAMDEGLVSIAVIQILKYADA